MFKKRILFFDGLRAVAIIAVFNIHFFSGFPQIDYFTVNPTIRSFMATLHSNIFGVSLFFLLSGYLIYGKYVTNYSFKNIDAAANFIKKRSLRLLPAYFLTTIIILNIPFFNIHIQSNMEFVKNITLVFLHENSNVKLYNPVAWTLAFEFQYILIVAIVIFFTSKYRKIMYFSLLIFYCILYYYFNKNLPLYTPDNVLCIILGSLLYEWQENNPFSKVNPFLSILGILSICYLWGNYYSLFVEKIGYVSVMSILAIILFTLLSNIFIKGDYIRHLLITPPFLFLGKISYSFYLTHYYVISYILNGTLGKGGSSIGMWFRYLICFTLSIILSTIIYYIAEYPYLRTHSKITHANTRVRKSFKINK